MRKGQSKGKNGLSKQVWTRLTESDYRYLESILKNTKDETMCGLLRKMIQRKMVRIYIQDESLHVVMEELAALRSEINAIGVNINQITRHYNSNKNEGARMLLAGSALTRFLDIEAQTNTILEIISKLSKKWLSSSAWEKV